MATSLLGTAFAEKKTMKRMQKWKLHMTSHAQKPDWKFLAFFSSNKVEVKKSSPSGWELLIDILRCDWNPSQDFLVAKKGYRDPVYMGGDRHP